MRRIVTAESVTQLDEAVRGTVLVAGSHGGVVAASYAAKAGVHAVILNDAGIGMDEAGIAGLAWLAELGMAAASVSHASARIGDGVDMLTRGVISRVNRHAEASGVRPGQPCHDAAVRLGAARAPLIAEVPPIAEGRYLLAEGVWGLDSIGMVTAQDAGRILVIGSHGALHGGRPESALGVDAWAALFNDAGVGVDGVGSTRLPVLARRGIPAGTVDCMSARIGDARSMWETGVLSYVNEPLSESGVTPGVPLKSAVARIMRCNTSG